MRFSRFMRLDAVGVAMYTSTWILAGYAFSGAIKQIIEWVQRVGHAFLFLGALLVGGLRVLDRDVHDQGEEVRQDR